MRLHFYAIFLLMTTAVPVLASEHERYSNDDIAVFVHFCSIASSVDVCLAQFLTPDETRQKADFILEQKKLGPRPWRGAECHTDDDSVLRCTVD